MTSGLFIPTKLLSNKWLNSIFRNRKGKHGGSVGFYIKDSITYKVRHDLS